MLVKFKATNGKIITVEGVLSVTMNDICFSQTGYGVHYDDGTYSLYNCKSWELISIEA